MLVDQYRKQFLDLIVGHRVVIIAHRDVDSVCTVKILTNLFKTEKISYILLSCDGIQGMKTKYEEYSGQSDWFIMVNCGGTVDLLETLNNPPPQKQFFLLDYHRPLHLINYYNTTNQIKIVSVPEPEEELPAFDEIVEAEADNTDDSSSDEDSQWVLEDDIIEPAEQRAVHVRCDSEDDSEDEDGMTRERRRGMARQAKMMKLQSWKDKRERLLFDYRQHSFHARPSALYALDIILANSRDDMESIWCAVVALMDSLVSGRLPRPKYVEFASTVNDHILRISNAEKLPKDCLKIRFEKELFLYLYRHWSVYEAAKHTPYLVNTLRTWSMDGERLLHEMLSQLGLPLVEAKQNYNNMSLDLRRQLLDMFSSEAVSQKFELPDVVLGSFIAEIGFRPKFSALDVQLATLAVLEDPDSGKSDELKFLDATHVLNVREPEAFNSGLEKGKAMLQLLNSQVQMMMDTTAKQVQEMGPFLIFQLSETLAEFNFFRRPCAIPLLAHSLQQASVRSGKRKWKQLQMLLMIPHSPEYFIAVGLPAGAYEREEKNIFSDVFRLLQNFRPEDIILDNFDGWVGLVKTSKRKQFIDVLLMLAISQ